MEAPKRMVPGGTVFDEAGLEVPHEGCWFGETDVSSVCRTATATSALTLAVAPAMTRVMAKKLRVQSPGIYHVMNRGDRREPIFRGEQTG